MSRFLGLSTTEFLSRHSDNGGTTLRSDGEGRCVFVTEAGGCKVHPARPLVCRLYPLGRSVDPAGAERFAVFPRQAGCEAAFGTDGTVVDFLGSQGVAPYIEWSERYGRLYQRMIGLLERLGIEGRIEMAAGGEEAGEGGGEGAPSDAAPISPWQDIDASLAEYCAAKGLPVPRGIEAAIDLHLEAMEQWLDKLERTHDELP